MGKKKNNNKAIEKLNDELRYTENRLKETNRYIANRTAEWVEYQKTKIDIMEALEKLKGAEQRNVAGTNCVGEE